MKKDSKFFIICFWEKNLGTTLLHILFSKKPYIDIFHGVNQSSKLYTIYFFHKLQSYDALKATLNAEAASLKTEITEIEKKIKKLELEWQDSQVSQISFKI